MRHLTLTLTLTLTIMLLCVRTAHSQNGPAQSPIYANSGLPDLAIDPQSPKDYDVVDRTFSLTLGQPGSCEIEEGTVFAEGTRRLLRFSVAIMNRVASFDVANSTFDPETWTWSWTGPYAQFIAYEPCHYHFHFDAFAGYQLFNAKGVPVLTGHKRSFCIMDVRQDKNASASLGYDCSHMGLTSGWSDVYDRPISGQWLDITGLPSGRYVLRITANPLNLINEGENRYLNTVDIPVSIPDPTKRVPYLYCVANEFYCP